MNKLSKNRIIVPIITATLGLLIGFLAGYEYKAYEMRKSLSEAFSATSNSSPSESSEDEKTSEYYFREGVLKLSDAEVKIKQTKVIPVGDTGNEYGDKPVIAFWFTTTNISGKEMDPSTAWIASIDAYQDNDPNLDNKLEIASLPDERFLDTQMENIKKGGTVEHAIAYELDDDSTPVVLKASRGIGGEKLGEQTFTIK